MLAPHTARALSDAVAVSAPRSQQPLACQGGVGATHQPRLSPSFLMVECFRGQSARKAAAWLARLTSQDSGATCTPRDEEEQQEHRTPRQPAFKNLHHNAVLCRIRQQLPSFCCTECNRLLLLSLTDLVALAVHV